MIEPSNIYKGDCLELMKDIPDGSVDCIICDLPYGITANKWDIVIPFDSLWEQYLRVAKQNAAILLFASQPFTSALVMSNVKLYRHEWIWIKNHGSNFLNTVREPMKEHESILMFSRGGWTYNRQLQERTGNGKDRVKYIYKDLPINTDNYRKGIIKARKFLGEKRVPSSYQKFNTEKGLHPTQKPVGLIQYLIRTYTNKGEVVLDNCMGSGTTCVAAIKENRKYIGMELNEKYFDIAKKRIDLEKSQPAFDFE